MAADGSVRPGRGPGASNGQRGGGLISAFARHPTAPNLAMVIFILLGVFALDRLNRQFFPDFEVPAITVTVAWPGASAEDTEANILDVLEPELRFIDNIEEVSSYARDGSATITLEFSPTADMQKAQSDVEQAVSRVTTLPEDAEQPIISRATLYDPIADIRITGPFSERVLKGYAKKLRDGLLNAGIDSVVLTGARDEEIWVKVREEELRRLGIRYGASGRRQVPVRQALRLAAVHRVRIGRQAGGRRPLRQVDQQVDRGFVERRFQFRPRPAQAREQVVAQILG